MIVTESTTTLHFIPSEDLTIARVFVYNEISGVTLIDESLPVTKMAYYYEINSNFGFVEGEQYIFEIFKNNDLIYRANLSCTTKTVRNEYQTITPPDSDSNYFMISGVNTFEKKALIIDNKTLLVNDKALTL